MWEDITIVVACLGFAAALALILVELRGMIADLGGEAQGAAIGAGDLAPLRESSLVGASAAGSADPTGARR